ncbi:hypothetical protein FEP53_05134 [Burkholderia multivorans]|nr:hypothetical protein [Burkholderia multivorans]
MHGDLRLQIDGPRPLARAAHADRRAAPEPCAGRQERLERRAGGEPARERRRDGRARLAGQPGDLLLQERERRAPDRVGVLLGGGAGRLRRRRRSGCGCRGRGDGGRACCRYGRYGARRERRARRRFHDVRHRVRRACNDRHDTARIGRARRDGCRCDGGCIAARARRRIDRPVRHEARGARGPRIRCGARRRGVVRAEPSAARGIRARECVLGRVAASGNHDHPVVRVRDRRDDRQHGGEPERARTPALRPPFGRSAKCAARHRRVLDPLIRFAF